MKMKVRRMKISRIAASIVKVPLRVCPALRLTSALELDTLYTIARRVGVSLKLPHALAPLCETAAG